MPSHRKGAGWLQPLWWSLADTAELPFHGSFQGWRVEFISWWFITMNQVEQSSWMTLLSQWLLRNYLHREEHLQQEIVFISIRTKSSFLCQFLGHVAEQRREQTVVIPGYFLHSLELCGWCCASSKIKFWTKIFFFIFFPRNSLLLFMVCCQLKYMEKASAVKLRVA